MLGALTAHVAALDQPERFVACVVATYQPATRTLTLAVAGMPSPLVLRATGETERIESSGPPLGMLARVAYSDVQVQLDDGDVVLFCTDGVIEQPGAGGLYGEERLLAAARHARTLPAAEMLAAIQRDVRAYGAGVVEDDLTMVALAITSEAVPAAVPRAAADRAG